MADQFLTQSGSRNPILERLAVLYRNNRYIAEDVFPVINTDKEIPSVAHFSLETMHRATDSRVSRSGKVSTTTLFFDEVSVRLQMHAELVKIPLNTQRSFRNGVGVGNLGLKTAMNKLKLSQELRVANRLFDAAKYGASFKNTPANKWTDGTLATPVQDVIQARDGVFGDDKYAVFGNRAWTLFSTHPKVVAGIQGVFGGVSITPERAAEFFGLKAIFVGNAKVLTGTKDSGSANEFIWGDSAVVFTRPSPENMDPDGYEPSFGYIYRKVENSNDEGSPEPIPYHVFQWEDQDEGGMGVLKTKAAALQDEVVVGAEGAFLIDNVE